MKRSIYYFGGGYVPAVNDLHVPAGVLDSEDSGADPVIFDQPGGGESADFFRQAEAEALLDPTLG